MTIELSVPFDERPTWRRIALELQNSVRCPDHPAIDGDVSVVVDHTSRPRYDGQGKLMGHQRPVAWVYCGSELCHRFETFTREQLPVTADV